MGQLIQSYTKKVLHSLDNNDRELVWTAKVPHFPTSAAKGSGLAWLGANLPTIRIKRDYVTRAWVTRPSERRSQWSHGGCGRLLPSTELCLGLFGVVDPSTYGKTSGAACCHNTTRERRLCDVTQSICRQFKPGCGPFGPLQQRFCSIHNY